LAHPGKSLSALEIQSAAASDRTVAANAGATGGAERVALERARVNVARALRAVLNRIDEHHPSLAQHLRVTVLTGAYCLYAPDPRVPAAWEVHH
jgi:non-specific serine/threonine protein kinase